MYFGLNRPSIGQVALKRPPEDRIVLKMSAELAMSNFVLLLSPLLLLPLRYRCFLFFKSSRQIHVKLQNKSSTDELQWHEHLLDH